MAPAMFVPWRGDWTSEKTGIHPPFKCSHTRLLFTPTTKQPAPKYAISLARFGNLALKVLGWKTSLQDSYCLYKIIIYTHIYTFRILLPVTRVLFIEKYEKCMITWNQLCYSSLVIDFNLQKRFAKFVVHLFL